MTTEVSRGLSARRVAFPRGRGRVRARGITRHGRARRAAAVGGRPRRPAAARLRVRAAPGAVPRRPGPRRLAAGDARGWRRADPGSLGAAHPPRVPAGRARAGCRAHRGRAPRAAAPARAPDQGATGRRAGGRRGACATAAPTWWSLDAYAGGRVPPELATVEWFAEVRRVLAPGGLLLANVADEPGLRYAARVAAGAREALGHVAFVGPARGAQGQAVRQPGARRLGLATRPLDAAAGHGIGRAAHRGAVVGRRRSAPAGRSAVQRGRR